MKDKNKNIKSTLRKIFRYHANELTLEERNSFEKELQKDPFAEEATEGFSEISEENALNDIEELTSRIKNKISHKHRFLFYRIAASIAILMVISTIFILTENNRSIKKTADNSPKSELLEIAENKPIFELPAKSSPSYKQIEAKENKKGKSASGEIGTGSGKKITEFDKTTIAEVSKNNSLSDVNAADVEMPVNLQSPLVPANALAKQRAALPYIARGKILSSEDNLPVPGANVFIKGTNSGVVTDSQGNFSINLPDSNKKTLVADYIGMDTKEFAAQPDSSLQIRLKPSVSALSEVVVVGYGVDKAENDKEDSSTNFTPPHPSGGRSVFNKYIQNNMHRPDSMTSGQRVVVVVSFLVRTDGKIDSVQVLRSPGKAFSDEAIRLIESGPSWLPAKEDGKTVEDIVKMRIVFR